MDWTGFFGAWGESAKTAAGFFWKSGWAFVLGYSISAMMQVFIPKESLTRFMGDSSPKSISLSTVFGAASSSCSFAALAAARTLVLKGAHFTAAVAFMFASTNLVIELGILIFIFLGWEFVVAELAGGVVLIAISSMLIVLTYPEEWLETAREKVEAEAMFEEEFDWRERFFSKEGWLMVGHEFVAEWKMVWHEILIGFTVAGFVAVLVPPSFYEAVFLMNMTDQLPQWLITLENAIVGPLVAMMTFIGSMGNIPLATVLNANGVLFAGIMGFIYSDLMVPPLVSANAKYYGWRVALYIAGIMFVSIVATALLMHYGFAGLGITPESEKVVEEVAQFKLDYSFWMNLGAIAVAGLMFWAHRRYLSLSGEEPVKGDETPLKHYITLAFVAALVLGGLALLFV